MDYPTIETVEIIDAETGEMVINGRWYVEDGFPVVDLDELRTVDSVDGLEELTL